MVKNLKDRIREAVINMFKINMGLQVGEKVLVLTDYPDKEHWVDLDCVVLEDITLRSLLAKAVYEIGKEEFPKNEFRFHVYPLTGMHGVEPPLHVIDLMVKHDVIIAITTYSLTHTGAREKATKAGARIASMPGFTTDMFEPGGPMAADYNWIKELSNKILEMVRGKKSVKVVNDYGTDITLSIEGREWDVDIGLYLKRGEWGNLPAGEVYIAPREGTANGVFVVPKGWYPRLEEDMKFFVQDGLVYNVEGGGKIGDYFRKVLGIEPENNALEYIARRNIAELGIGTNPNARRPDNILEAEKILGTVHIAIGDNSHFGGKIVADLHEDFIQPKPTVTIDGEILIYKGSVNVK